MRRHELDLLSLLTGLAFVALGIVFLAGWFDGSVLRFRWMAAGLLVVLGLGMLLSARSGASGRDDREARDQSPRPIVT